MIPEHSQLFVEMGDEISSRQYIGDLHTTFGLVTFPCCISLIAKRVERHRLVSVDVRRALYHSQLALTTTTLNAVKIVNAATTHTQADLARQRIHVIVTISLTNHLVPCRQQPPEAHMIRTCTNH